MKTNKLFNKKSPLFIIATILSCFLLILFSIWVAGKAVVHPNETYDTTSQVDIKTPEGELKYEEVNGLKYFWKEKDGAVVNKYKIMTTTDLHIQDHDSDFTLNVLSNLVDHEKPDLVVLVGDNIYGLHEQKSADKLINLFETKHQYWTFVLGNHDGEGWEKEMSYVESRQKAFDVLTGKDWQTKPKYCLATSEGNDRNKFGFGTNCINIGKPNNILQSLYFFDCKTIQNKVNDDVINWYHDKTLQVKAANNNVLPQSIAFNHIPFIEMQTGYELLGKDKDALWHFGNIEEPIADDLSQKNGLFEAFIDGNTKTVVFGHDHDNNLCLSYKGVKMIFNLGLAFNCYTRRNCSFRAICNDIFYGIDDSLCDYIDGTTDYIIENNKQVEIASVYNQFNGIFDGLEDQLRAKCHFFITYNATWITILFRVLAPILSAGVIVYFVFFTKENINKKTKKTK